MARALSFGVSDILYSDILSGRFRTISSVAAVCGAGFDRASDICDVDGGASSPVAGCYPVVVASVGVGVRVGGLDKVGGQLVAGHGRGRPGALHRRRQRRGDGRGCSSRRRQPGPS